MPHPLRRRLDDVLESPHKQYFHTDGNQIVPKLHDTEEILKELQVAPGNAEVLTSLAQVCCSPCTELIQPPW